VLRRAEDDHLFKPKGCMLAFAFAGGAEFQQRGRAGPAVHTVGQSRSRDDPVADGKDSPGTGTAILSSNDHAKTGHAALVCQTDGFS